MSHSQFIDQRQPSPSESRRVCLLLHMNSSCGSQWKCQTSTTAMVYIDNMIVSSCQDYRHIDQGYTVDVNFAKAFDKIPHQRLFDKLKGHGIYGKMFKWTKSWLSNRRQKVYVQGKFSVISGVLAYCHRYKNTRAHHRDEIPERDVTYHLTCLLIYH